MLAQTPVHITLVRYLQHVITRLEEIARVQVALLRFQEFRPLLWLQTHRLVVLVAVQSVAEAANPCLPAQAMAQVVAINGRLVRTIAPTQTSVVQQTAPMEQVH